MSFQFDASPDTSNPAMGMGRGDAMDIDVESDDDELVYGDGVSDESWANGVNLAAEPEMQYESAHDIINGSPFVRVTRDIAYLKKTDSLQTWFEKGEVRKAYAINLLEKIHFSKNADFWQEHASTRQAPVAHSIEGFLSDAMQWITQRKGDINKVKVKPSAVKHYELLFYRMDSVTGVRDYAHPNGRASDVPAGIRVWFYDVTPYTDADIETAPVPAVVPQAPPSVPPNEAPLMSDDSDLELSGMFLYIRVFAFPTYI